jgi:hypothetical protein
VRSPRSIVAAIRRAAKQAALGGVKLPSPRQALERSRQAGGAHVVGSDGKFHVYLTDEQRRLGNDCYAFKERLDGWADFEVPPERALKSVPSYQRPNITKELDAALRWPQRFKELWEAR